jgi:hypothetical protein
MPRSNEPRFPVVARRSAGFLVFLVLISALAAATAGQRGGDTAARVAQQQPTRFLYLGMEPGATYRVQTNESTFETVSSPDPSGGGIVEFANTATTGELITLTNTGVAEVFPTEPTGLTLTDLGANCARLSWDTPERGEYVSDYRVYFGPSSGVYTDSLDIGNSEWTRPDSRSYASKCGFPSGTWYFAIRAHNAFDHWSGLGNEVRALITGRQVQPPAPPTDVAATETSPGCVTVSWTASGSAGVTGYTVYWGAVSSVYTDSSDVSGGTEKEICGFGPGRRYFAVKTRAGAETSAYSGQVSLDIEGPDTTPPVISQLRPAEGETSVARNTAVFFTVSDAGAGVDASTIDVTINGSSGWINPLGSGAQYMVVAGLAAPLPSNASIQVIVTVSDLADPANEGTRSWTFETGDQIITDTAPPVFSGLSPANGEASADPEKPVRVTITDGGLGIDLSSIAMYINGDAVAFTLSGDIYSAAVSYTGDLEPGTTANVRLEACDLAEPANCGTLTDYSFVVAGANFVSLPDGAIVPDGFWANDPERPLEIRNLPRNWTVRIFDTSGTQVRRYRNESTGGENWLWDFNNDHGRRVARAIYLVRVSDENGAVQRSGRFLVQIDP